MKELSIPQISDEELMRRYLKIKPIAEVGDAKYWLRNYSIDEMRNTSYFWNLFPDKRKPIGKDLYTHDYHEFECLHSFGSFGFFKPTIAEVLAQIPEDALKHFTIDAFEIIGRPTSNGDFNMYRKALDQGFHVSIVRLYIRPEP